jgi:hypothetical protein
MVEGYQLGIEDDNGKWIETTDPNINTKIPVADLAHCSEITYLINGSEGKNELIVNVDFQPENVVFIQNGIPVNYNSDLKKPVFLYDVKTRFVLPSLALFNLLYKDSREYTDYESFQAKYSKNGYTGEKLSRAKQAPVFNGYSFNQIKAEKNKQERKTGLKDGKPSKQKVTGKNNYSKNSKPTVPSNRVNNSKPAGNSFSPKNSTFESTQKKPYTTTSPSGSSTSSPQKK